MNKNQAFNVCNSVLFRPKISLLVEHPIWYFIHNIFVTNKHTTDFKYKTTELNLMNISGTNWQIFVLNEIGINKIGSSSPKNSGSKQKQTTDELENSRELSDLDLDYDLQFLPAYRLVLQYIICAGL